MYRKRGDGGKAGDAAGRGGEELDPALVAGADLFDGGALYEAHEAWEDVWRAAPAGERRELLQGLIQVAVALLHRDRSNPAGAATVGRRASERLAALPPTLCGVDVAGLRALLVASLAEPPGAPLPRLPHAPQRP